MATTLQDREPAGRRPLDEGARHLFTVDEYERMIDAGVLAGARVELLRGEVVEVSGMNAGHARALEYLGEELPPRLPREAYALRIQTPLAIPEHDEPEPDVMVLRRRRDRYAGRLPGAADVVLLIEVSDTTYRTDRRRKLSVYAAGGVGEVWIADLSGAGAGGLAGVERHTEPDPEAGEYRSEIRFGRGETVASLAIPVLTLPADEILGPPELAVDPP